MLAATAITVAILLFAFGALGMLLLARAPQEPIARTPDPFPPSVAQTELPEAPAVVATEPLIVSAPEPAPFPSQEQLEKEAAVMPSSGPDAEPETTAAIPDAPAQDGEQPPEAQPQNQVQPQSQVQPQNEAQPQSQPQPKSKVRRAVPQQQRAVRRQVRKKSEPRSDNPLMQLFGIRQYR